jgi:3-oxosteroid 1-dehydrogenase
VMLAYTIPPVSPGDKPTCIYAGIVELCSPHTIVVNRSGRRFADETFFQGIVPQLRLFGIGKRPECNRRPALATPRRAA